MAEAYHLHTAHAAHERVIGLIVIEHLTLTTQ